MIIFNYMRTDRELKTIEAGGIDSVPIQESSTDITKAQLFLEREMGSDKKSMLHFLINLKDLRSAVIHRRKDILRKE